MVCRRVFTLLFLVLATTAANAQQNPGSQNMPAQTPPAKNDLPANLNLPVSKEKWTSLSDTKTGLEPQPADHYQLDDKQPEFVREIYRLQWRASDPIDVWVIRPKIAGKVLDKAPAILHLYTYTDTDDRFRDNDWAKRATAGGYAAVGFTSALSDYRFKNRAFSKWFVSELPESLGSTVHDVQLVLDFLATTNQIDMNRVGVFGVGSGATIAILAAQADPRISTVDVLEPWGDWPAWMAKTNVLSDEERPKYTTKEFLDSVAPLDPVRYLPGLKTPHVRIQFVLNGKITPPAARDAIAAAIPARATVVKYQTAAEIPTAWQGPGWTGWVKQQLNPQGPTAASNDNHATNAN